MHVSETSSFHALVEFSLVEFCLLFSDRKFGVSEFLGEVFLSTLFEGCIVFLSGQKCALFTFHRVAGVNVGRKYFVVY